MTRLLIYACAATVCLGQASYAQSNGWVLWLVIGNQRIYHSRLIADAFDGFAGCQKTLDTQTAAHTRGYPKERFDVKIFSRNAVRTIEATEILNEEEAKKKKQSLARNILFNSYSDEELEKMSKHGDTTRIQIMCLPGGTNPPQDKERSS